MRLGNVGLRCAFVRESTRLALGLDLTKLRRMRSLFLAWFFLSIGWAGLLAAKSPPPAPFIYTPDRIERAHANVAKYAWAETLVADMMNLADEAASQPVDRLRAWFTVTTPNDQTSCPRCGEYWLNYVWDWQPDEPDRLVCNYCDHVIDADTYPQNGEIRRTTPQGEIVPHPVYRDEAGKTYPIWQTIGFKKADYAYAWIEALGVAYALTGEDRYATTATHLLYRLAEVYPGYILHDNFRFDEYPWGWAGKLTGWHLKDAQIFMKLGTAWDLIRHSETVTSAERAFIEENLFRQGGEMFTAIRPLQGISNDVAYRFGAVALIGRLLQDDEILAWVLAGNESYDRVLDHLFFTDGAWHERSLSYHGMMTRSVWMAPYYLDGYEKNQVNLRDHPKMGPIHEIAFQMRFPDGDLPPTNDGRLGSRPSVEGVEALYVMTGEEKWLAYAQAAYDGELLERGDLFSLFNRPVDVDERLATVTFDTSVPTVSADYTGMGLFMLRRGEGENRTVFTMHHHKHANSHTHYSALSTIVWAQGREMLSDLGYAVFGVRERTTWYNASLSHNTLTVDTLNQRSPNGVANYIYHGDFISACEGESWDSYRFICEPFARQIALIDGPNGRPYGVDIFRGGGGSVHDWALHGEGPDFSVDGVELAATPSFPGKDYAYEEVSDVRVGEVEGPSRVRWAWADGAVLDAHLADQGDSRLFTTQSPGRRLRDQVGRKISSAFVRRTGDDVRSQFIAAFDPHAGDSQVESVEIVEVSPEAHWALVFKVELVGGFTDYVLASYIDVAPQGEVFVAGELEIPWESRFGVVRVKDGAIVRSEWVDAPMEGLAHDI
jgi:hypothetical protein